MNRIIAAVALLGVAACSSSDSDKAGGDAASPSAMTFETAVDCQANLTAVGRIFSVLATQEEGTKKDAMVFAANKRDTAATAFRDLAKKLGAVAGRSEADITTAMDAADAAIKAEFEKRPFEDFAVWAGARADGCVLPS
jgi:hypothetical protein